MSDAKVCKRRHLFTGGIVRGNKIYDERNTLNKTRSIYITSIPLFFFVMYITCDMNELYNGARPSSDPYLSGDTFRKYCDHIFDAKEQNFVPSEVETGDLVFVAPRDYDRKTLRESLDDFFKNYHPFIKNKYILVTHNSDLNITEEFRDYLESKTLFVWFAQNIGFKHPKLIPIPIGLENELWHKNYVRTLNSIRGDEKYRGKKYLLFMNFGIKTNNNLRMPIYNLFKDKDFCYAPQSTDTETYLHDVYQAKFVISPHGNGLDCHRTWEALYLGVIPVVKKSTLDPLYEDLPVLIVDDWSEITREFLEKKYIEISAKTYKFEKLFIDYWIEVFRNYKELCKATILPGNY